MTRGRRRWTGLAVLPLLVGSWAWWPTTASADLRLCPQHAYETPAGDVDGDGSTDVAVGAPRGLDDNDDSNDQNATGAVTLFYGPDASTRFTPTDLGYPPVESGGFGSAIALVDVNHDRCGDLAVGAPGEGAVYLVLGSSVGVSVLGSVRIPSPGAAGDRFGASVAADVRGGVADLWVGAPDATVTGHRVAGAVYHYVLDGSGAPTLRATISYADLPGAVAAGDHFGQVLSPLDDGVSVGVPHRTVSGHAQAGEVAFLHQTDGALTAQVVNQDTAGVPGAAEAGDHFGAATDGGLVGVPDEDLGTIKDAGSVQVFTGPGPTYAAGRPYHQGAGGLPGTPERGDRFGASVTHAYGRPCPEASGFAAGSPGEDVGKVSDTGSVIIAVVDDSGKVCSASYSQGHGLTGVATASAHVGTSLVPLSAVGADEDAYLPLAVGAPGAAASRGLVYALGHRSQVFARYSAEFADLDFGAVLGHVAAGPAY